MKSVLLLALLTVSECGSSSVVGQTGQNVILPCTYDFKNYRALSVCWGRGDLPLSGCNKQLISTDGLKVKEGTRNSSRYQLLGRLDEGDVSLTILNVTDSDAGRYGCRVNISGWFNDDKHHVDLTVETVSECGSSSVVGQTSQNVILPCTYNFKNYRALSVCWGRGDLPLSGCNKQLISTHGCKVKEGTRASSRYQLLGRLDKGDVSLTILNVTDSDAGRYGCRVNISGWFNDNKHHVDLTVQTDGSSTTTSSTTSSTSTSTSSTTSSTSSTSTSTSSVAVSVLICCFLLLLFFITFFILMRRRRSQTTTGQPAENVYVVMQGNRGNETKDAEKQENEEESDYVVCNRVVPMKTPLTQQMSVDAEDIYV